MLSQIGIWGIVVIGLALLLFFGPKRLPMIGRSLGRGMREFKDAVTGADKKAALPGPKEPAER